MNKLKRFPSVLFRDFLLNHCNCAFKIFSFSPSVLSLLIHSFFCFSVLEVTFLFMTTFYEIFVLGPFRIMLCQKGNYSKYSVNNVPTSSSVESFTMMSDWSLSLVYGSSVNSKEGKEV